MTNPSDMFEGLDEIGLINKHWQGMPEFNQPDNSAHRQIIVSFEDDAGVEEFAKLLKQTITKKTKSLWFPYRAKNNVTDLFWIQEPDSGSTPEPDAE
jgi:hypothetical protein